VDTNSRAAHHLGEFGEGLASYTLIRKGFEVAWVNHVGADLIAQRGDTKIAVSVKARRFRAGSKETRSDTIKYAHIEQLEYFAMRFNLEPVYIHLACIDDDRMIHLFMLRIVDVKQYLDRVEKGHRLRFEPHHIEQTKALPFLDYSSWNDEQIGNKLYPISPRSD